MVRSAAMPRVSNHVAMGYAVMISTQAECALVPGFRGVVFPGDGVDLLQDLRPSFAHALERKIVPRRAEAGMHQAKPGAAIDLGERQRDDGLEARAVSDIVVMPASPCVDQPLVRRRLQYLAMDDAVPFAGRRGLVGELLALRGLEAGRRHEPAADQLA